MEHAEVHGNFCGTTQASTPKLRGLGPGRARLGGEGLQGQELARLYLG